MPRRLVLAVLALALLAGIRASGLRAEEDGPVTRTVDLGALLAAPRDARAPWLGLGPRGAAQYEEYDLPWWGPSAADESETPAPLLEPEELRELLVAVVPGLGEEEGEELVVAEGRLIVTATPDRQAQVDRALAELWTVASRRVRIDAAWFTLAPGSLDDAARGRLLGGSLTAAEASALARVCAPGGRGSLLVAPGRRTWLGEVQSTAYLAGYLVEIAQNSIVGDPQVETLETGWAVEVAAFPLLGGGVLLEVESASAASEETRRLELGVPPLGALELPACRVARFGTRLVVAPDERRALVLPAADDAALVLLLAASVADAPPPGLLGARFEVGALAAAPARRALRAHHDDPGLWPRLPQPSGDETPLVGLEALVDLLRDGPDARAWETEGAWLSGRPDAVLARSAPDVLARARALLTDVERSALRPRRLTLALASRAGDGPATPLAEAVLDVPAGLPAYVQSGREQAYLADWSVEVAQEARVGQPEVRVLFEGFDLNLRVDPAPGADALAVTIDLRYSRAARPLERREPGNECTGAIEVPDLRRLHWSDDVVLTGAGAVTRDLGALDEATRLEVTLREVR